METDKWVMFVWQDWSKIFFAWWNEWEAKFILQSLVQKHWIKRWTEVYKDFCEALLWIKDIKWNRSDKWFTTASLVMYKWYDNKIPKDEGSTDSEEIHCEE